MTTERSQCVGLVLALVGALRLDPQRMYSKSEIVALLEELATEMEAQGQRIAARVKAKP